MRVLWPWVSRWRLDAAITEREHAEERVAAADQRAREAEHRAVNALAEARLVLAEATGLARLASHVINPGYLDTPHIENPPSVGEADRQAAQRARVAAEDGRRR